MKYVNEIWYRDLFSRPHREGCMVESLEIGSEKFFLSLRPPNLLLSRTQTLELQTSQFSPSLNLTYVHLISP